MPPGSNRAVFDRSDHFLTALEVILIRKLMGQVEVVPADGRVFDQPSTTFCKFLLFLFSAKEFVVPKRDGFRKLIGIFALVKLLFDGFLAQRQLIDVTEDKDSLDGMTRFV